MRTFSLITILVLASLGFAQDCNNPLLGFFGLPGLDAPQSGADLPYCNGLQGAETCCSADTVASFQDRANGLIDRLNNHAAGRDLYVAQLRNNFYNRFNNILEDTRQNHNDDLNNIRQADAAIADQLQADIDSSTQIDNDAREINEQFTAALGEYQQARTNCFNAALQAHTSSWCLACDPNYATQGVAGDGTVTFSDGLCQAINDACWPYFDQSARFNPLFRAREAYWRLVAASRYLGNYSNTNEVTPFDVPEDPYNPLSTQLGTNVPEQWVPGDAEAGQCIDLWSQDQSLAELLTIGANAPAPVDDGEAPVDDGEAPVDDGEAPVDDGEAPVDDGETPVVVVPQPANDDIQVSITDPNAETRLLQDALAGDNGVWAPDLEATGLDFGGLRTDPGDYFGASDYPEDLNQN